MGRRKRREAIHTHTYTCPSQSFSYTIDKHVGIPLAMLVMSFWSEHLRLANPVRITVDLVVPYQSLRLVSQWFFDHWYSHEQHLHLKIDHLGKWLTATCKIDDVWGRSPLGLRGEGRSWGVLNKGWVRCLWW